MYRESAELLKSGEAEATENCKSLTTCVTLKSAPLPEDGIWRAYEADAGVSAGSALFGPATGEV
jgi:hypothetical protein